MGRADLQRMVSAAPRAALDEAEYQRLKHEDFRRPTLAIGLACAVLVFSLWLWDWAIDARHAPDTFWLRVLLSVSILPYPLALMAGVRRGLPLVFYAMLVWLEAVFLLILARLEGGAVHGIAGFMFWFIVPPLMSFILRLRANVLGNFAVLAGSSLLAGPAGLLPEMDLLRLNAILVPACGITIVGHVMIDRLLRRIYEYRWQLEWRSVAIDALAEGVTIIQDGAIRYANPAAAALVGRRPEQLVGTPLRGYVNVDEKTDLSQPLRVEAGGRETWVRIGRSAILWQGRPAMLVSVADVTEQLRADEALRASEQRYREVVDNVSEGIIVVQDEAFAFTNPAAATLTGYAPEEMRGRPFADFVYPEDLALVAERYRRRLAGESLAPRYEFRILKKGGAPIWAQLSGVVIRWNGRPANLYFISDVDERKRSEAEIRAALEKQKELSELKTRFVSMTSHEFRTPLAAILSSAELLKHYGERLPEGEKTELVDSIGQSVRRMTHMLEDILTIGRAEAGRLGFAPAPLELRAMCERIVDEAARAAQAEGRRGDRIVLRMAGGEAQALLDERLMRHILGNLLSNALKYSPDDKPVALTVEADAAGLRFTVADEGIGIPPEDLPHLFETFHRARNVGNVSGTGLGLAIVRQAVELHGGRIEADSAPGAGSRFTVTLERKA
ncbi:MAG: Adaptive-response sensory-kinase SasA [Rhodocyclaceae bacterium]|nr:Adaptive-response sensory-kinase SasA [Rhodocyclaceae bacterium]CAG0943956.1 two-component system, OmpR family, sensor histidine kinase VicK [Gammaproteobacteria bacterium]